MMQYSIYIKPFHNYESANYGKKRLKEFIDVNTLKGSIRMILFTDKQFSNIEIVLGEQDINERQAPIQLELF